MNIIDHGEWEVYTPSVYPSDMPSGVVFMRRKSDLVDWYKYIYQPASPKPTHSIAPIVLTKNFGADTVKFAVMWRKEFNAYIVGGATRDVTAIVPHGQTVYEITDYAGDDPFKEFNGKAYDHATGTFIKAALVDPPASPFAPLLEKIEALSVRVANLEKQRKES
jgi:hypothetical protein